MGRFTRDNSELAVDTEGAGQQYRAEAGGMTIALERWNAGLDTTEWFADLPGGACQEPHWDSTRRRASTPSSWRPAAAIGFALMGARATRAMRDTTMSESR